MAGRTGAARSCHVCSALSDSRWTRSLMLSLASLGEHLDERWLLLYSPKAVFVARDLCFETDRIMCSFKCCRGLHWTLFHCCLFIVSRACHVYRLSCGSANHGSPVVSACARYGLIFLVGGGRTAFPPLPTNIPHQKIRPKRAHAQESAFLQTRELWQCALP